MSSDNGKTIPGWVRLVNSGVAGMSATVIVQPMDLVKNRMQLAAAGNKKDGVIRIVRNIIAQDGIFAMYNGLSAGLFRQATYTSSRIAIYTMIREQHQKRGGQETALLNMGFGMVAGGLASVVGNPAEVCLVRMTADGRLPVAERRNYNHVFNALGRIIKEEGILTLWRGCQPTVVRAMVVNMAQLPTFTEVKKLLVNKFDWENDTLKLRFAAGMVSALVTTFVSIPVDITKTRLQNMKYIDGKPEYTGVRDVVTKAIKAEGPLSLWKGFIPYWFRLGPHTIFTFIFVEQLTTWYKVNVLKDMSKGTGL